MKVSGFTFIRNAIKFDYPVVEAIRSILPLCDEVIVAVGNSEDATLSLIQSIDDPKIKIIETQWDDSLRKGGRVLALETNKALAAVSSESDWCFYIQADEVIHEKYHSGIRQALELFKNDARVEGFLFKYLHFYGSYDYVGSSRKWYKNEIRIIRNNIPIQSYRDAQGFRKKDNTKLRVKVLDAFVYHYGWVKPPEAQQAKQLSFHKMWHDEQWMQKNIPDVAAFDYSQIDSLSEFSDTHPKVMQERIKARNWRFSFNPAEKKWGLKMRILMYIERTTGWRVGEYKNYHII